MCFTARSGIWVLKGNARTCMLPENLDHLRVGWISWGSYKTSWVTPWHDCLCPYKYGRGAAVRPQTDDAVWDGVTGLWSNHRVQGECANGTEPDPVFRFRIPWHSDDASLFGPPNQPKLTVSMSLGHSVVFQVRRVPFDVPSSITLDHGDLLVMDGSAQSEYAHRTVGLVLFLLILVTPRAVGLGGRRWRLSRRRQFPRKVSFYFPFIFGKNLCSLQGYGFLVLCTAEYASS